MDVSMSFSMASWASNMIISIVSCGVGTCGDSVPCLLWVATQDLLFVRQA
jgi:hypothetical protein